ncbi:hypothetical protein CCHR01_03155 [Colletotrichum chrysophilum]|uniref:Uncharacterized protein n=1 Tax=Colletotrichum chrysophilum TaxID=1836956 RepID=A0AAD9ATD7_9PEZI|nr:hypothetical protein CCHR01_03155 [Colletotrichum chrysophilum]
MPTSLDAISDFFRFVITALACSGAWRPPFGGLVRYVQWLFKHQMSDDSNGIGIVGSTSFR